MSCPSLAAACSPSSAHAHLSRIHRGTLLLLFGTYLLAAPRPAAAIPSYLSAPMLPAYSVGPSGITVECWAQVRSVPGYDSRILYATSEPIGSMVEPSEVVQLYVCSCSACPKGSLGFGLTHNVNLRGEPFSRTRIDDGGYHHLAGTYDGQKMRIYVDGNLEDSLAYGPYAMDLSVGSLVVGNSNALNNPFDGQVDEIRIWDHARTAAEIATDMLHEIPAGSPGLISCWRLNGDGTDLAGGNSLVPHGNANFVSPGKLGSSSACIPDVSTSICGKQGTGGPCLPLGTDQTAPVISLISPTGGETITADSTWSIRWLAGDNAGVLSVDLSYSTDGGASYHLISGGVPNAPPYSWQVPANASTASARVRVRAHDPAGNIGSAASLSDFTIVGDTTRPVVSLLAPNGGEMLTFGTLYPIQWSASDNVGVVSVDLEFSNDGGIQFSSVIQGLPNSPPYSWAVPNLSTSIGRIRITAHDRAGNLTRRMSNANFSICGAAAAPGLAFLRAWGACGTGDGQFAGPRGIAYDGANAIYVSDTENNRIQKFDPSGNFLLKWGTGGKAPGQFGQPLGMAVAASGDVYVVDYLNNRIQEFTMTGGFVRTWGDSGSGPGQFCHPQDVARDAFGNLYVTDYCNQRVQKFNATGSFLGQWGSAGSGPGQFSLPSGIAVDAGGTVYVVDSGNSRVQKFTGSGVFLGQWGSAGTCSGLLDLAIGCAVGTAGTIFVTDYNANRISEFNGDGAILHALGSPGTGEGRFNGPWGMDADGQGNLYAVDVGNCRVEKFGAPIQPPLPTGGTGWAVGKSPSRKFLAGTHIGEELQQGATPGFKIIDSGTRFGGRLPSVVLSTGASAGEVHLELLDASGRRMGVLFQGWLPARMVRKIPSESFLQVPSRMPAGVYFLSLRSPEGNSAQKILVLN